MNFLTFTYIFQHFWRFGIFQIFRYLTIFYFYLTFWDFYFFYIFDITGDDHICMFRCMVEVIVLFFNTQPKAGTVYYYFYYFCVKNHKKGHDPERILSTTEELKIAAIWIIKTSHIVFYNCPPFGFLSTLGEHQNNSHLRLVYQQ